MMRAAAFKAALLLAGCSTAAAPDPEAAAKAREKAGTALAMLPPPRSEGERMYNANCAVCHADGKLYPATLRLEQNGQAEPVLARRTDLDREYIVQVVRNGMGTMPSFSPTHVTDAQLEAIADWLTKERK